MSQDSSAQMENTGQASQGPDDVCDVTIEISSDMIEEAQAQDDNQQVYYQEEVGTVGMQQVCIVESRDRGHYGFVREERQREMQMSEESPAAVEEVVETEVVEMPEEKDLLVRHREVPTVERAHSFERERVLQERAQHMLEAEKRRQMYQMNMPPVAAAPTHWAPATPTPAHVPVAPTVIRFPAVARPPVQSTSGASSVPPPPQVAPPPTVAPPLPAAPPPPRSPPPGVPPPPQVAPPPTVAPPLPAAPPPPRSPPPRVAPPPQMAHPHSAAMPSSVVPPLPATPPRSMAAPPPATPPQSMAGGPPATPPSSMAVGPPVTSPPQMVPRPPVTPPPQVTPHPPATPPPQVAPRPPATPPPQVAPRPPVTAPSQAVHYLPAAPPPSMAPPLPAATPPPKAPPLPATPPPAVAAPPPTPPPQVVRPPPVATTPPATPPPQVVRPPPIATSPSATPPPQAAKPPPVTPPPQVAKPPVATPPPVAPPLPTAAPPLATAPPLQVTPPAPAAPPLQVAAPPPATAPAPTAPSPSVQARPTAQSFLVSSTAPVATPTPQSATPPPSRVPSTPTSARPITSVATSPAQTPSVASPSNVAPPPTAALRPAEVPTQQPAKQFAAQHGASSPAPTVQPTAPLEPMEVETSQGSALQGAGNSVEPMQEGESIVVPQGTRPDAKGSVPAEVVHIPHVLEEILATSERALERGEGVEIGSGDAAPEARRNVPAAKGPVTKQPTRLVAMDEGDDEDEEAEAPKTAPESKSKKKKKKKKKRAQRLQQQKQQQSEKDKKEKGGDKEGIDADIEYVQETIDSKDPYYYQFLLIFEKFKLQEPEKGKGGAGGPGDQDAQSEASLAQRLLERKKPADLDEKDDDDLAKAEEKPKLSKRKLKKLSRMSIAELKQKVNRPELVEMHDVTAKDPVLLLHLKSSRNTVPVPRHWCFKRKYLQGKRGIEKPPFDLPGFIKKTGIMEMRQALQEKEDQKTMKAKMREKVRPKLGKIDIDYQKLHDAFFKWQTKPRMTMHGDLYYEGKEFETRLKEKKPGDLSDDLRIALGMPTGPNSHKCPPPWLIAMQRYGPPPSYPSLKIPGLNAPIPDGCSFGYHAGGWGKPPVDEMGRPLYGDVFGTQSADGSNMLPEEEVDRSLWGELESESSEESEAEDESEEEERAEDESGLVTPAEGLVTPSGFTSIPAGVETPDMIELRKRKIETEMEGGDTPSLYTVLPEKRAERVGAAMMGSTHIYDMSAALAKGARAPAAGGASERPGGVEIALDPSELEMDQAAMAARYEQTLREQQSHLAKEDLSDMVAEHAARQKSKRKKQQQDGGKSTKKYKEFKF